VTVIGLGPMGRATVKVLLDAGVDVTVWNRTAAKADEMAALGARRAETVADAIAANDVALVSLTHYDAMYDVLDRGSVDLTGTTIVNLSSDSPLKTDRGAHWVMDRGGAFLTGAYMTQGDDIKHPVSRLYVSGPEPVYDKHRGLLELLCPTEYLGAGYGTAQLYYQAELAMFHAFLISVQQAVAMIERSGGDVDRFLALASTTPASYAGFMSDVAAEAKAGGAADLAGLAMMHAGAQHVIEASEDVGVDAALTRTVQGYYRRALDAGEERGHPVPVYQIIRGDAE
jgi:3-hydroxyisobutyrate dehydrogenase-like beta-hydroxyacid dehydrogenase